MAKTHITCEVPLTQLMPFHWIGVDTKWDGQSEPWPYLVSVPPQQLATHALLLGSTGSGKSTLLHHLIAQDILLGHSFCVLDLRGDMVAAVEELCAGNVEPEQVAILDPREKKRALGFNPLKGSGEPYFRALNVLDVVAAESESWGVQLSETLRNALLLLSEAQEPLTELESVFYDSAFRAECMKRCETEAVLGFWHRYADYSANQQASYASSVLNKVSLLLSTPSLRRILGHPAPIDLGKHLNTPGSILLVSLAVDELHSAGRMLGSFVLAAIYRESSLGWACRNPSAIRSGSTSMNSKISQVSISSPSWLKGAASS